MGVHVVALVRILVCKREKKRGEGKGNPECLPDQKGNKQRGMKSLFFRLLRNNYKEERVKSKSKESI